ncbi:MAG: hypothetical protein ACXVIE_08565 [Halobacteriota archaeon]
MLLLSPTVRPQDLSPLAKSLKTYLEDIHRTLQSLIDKGMVRPSLYPPTYTLLLNSISLLDPPSKSTRPS